jgi:hypothetical protein
MRFRVPILALALCTTGCASAHKNAYIAASVTKQVTTEAHEIWSVHLNEKVDECNPDSNSAITTENQFDECLGVYANNDDIVMALEIYKNVAESLFNALKDPDFEKGALTEIKRRAIEAAWELLKKLPDEGPYKVVKNQLQAVVGR